MKALSFKGIWILLKDSFGSFMDDKVPKLGASLAYFTLFSVGPMLLVIIFVAGLLLGRQAIEGSLRDQIQALVGDDAAEQVQQLIASAATSEQGTIAAVIGIITLVISASSVFAEMQDSINEIWHVKLKPKQGWQLMLKNRMLAFGIVASMGFLLIVSMAAAAIIESLGQHLEKIIPGVSVSILFAVSHAFTFVISTVLFAVIFKILPAARIKWADVWPGAVATVLLFMAGRFAISLYISQSDFGDTYGAAGSLVVVLVWIYYSSLIFYFGVEFTKAYAKRFGSGIHPMPYAVSTAEG